MSSVTASSQIFQTPEDFVSHLVNDLSSEILKNGSCAIEPLGTLISITSESLMTKETVQ